jgi:hypothetical protein
MKNRILTGGRSRQDIIMHWPDQLIFAVLEISDHLLDNLGKVAPANQIVGLITNVRHSCHRFINNSVTFHQSSCEVFTFMKISRKRLSPIGLYLRLNLRGERNRHAGINVPG